MELQLKFRVQPIPEQYGWTFKIYTIQPSARARHDPSLSLRMITQPILDSYTLAFLCKNSSEQNKIAYN